MSTLQIRLKNCIQTILEFEPDLRSEIWNHHFSQEFLMLKNYLQHIDSMELAEDDVQRLEVATDNFLAELRFSSNRERQPYKRLLQ